MRLVVFNGSPNCKKVTLPLRRLEFDRNDRVSTLVDGDLVPQSGAILTHRVERHCPAGPGVGPRGRADVARSMYFETSVIAPYARPVALHATHPGAGA